MDTKETVQEGAVPTIVDRLKEGIVHFEYTSSKGARVAYGTLNRDLIPNQVKEVDINNLVSSSKQSALLLDRFKHDYTRASDSGGIEMVIQVLEDSIKPFLPKEAKKKSDKPANSNVTYYDFEKKGFRVFKEEALIKIF